MTIPPDQFSLIAFRRLDTGACAHCMIFKQHKGPTYFDKNGDPSQCVMCIEQAEREKK